ncbi:hypothetical protein BB558_007637 [Smittium angustum]|uniref:Adenylate kinase isoenzyme 6 homolog n=1 Tax=Smittium angustum TaxID=133377 RepID=A0A2U1IUK1_SMIAN|nr:hypothetical protein BB558_007637 [Smittium angustum]
MTDKLQKPNILITGTPGTGKSTTSEMVAELLGYNLINVGEIIKSEKLHDGHDAEFDTYWLNEDKVLDHLEPLLANGANIVDYHSCDFFPERWFQLVVVLHTQTEKLYDRLVARNYNEKKISENMQCEIMMVVADEARASYKEEIVVELDSNTVDDMENNVNFVSNWINTNYPQLE